MYKSINLNQRYYYINLPVHYFQQDKTLRWATSTWQWWGQCRKSPRVVWITAWRGRTAKQWQTGDVPSYFVTQGVEEEATTLEDKSGIHKLINQSWHTMCAREGGGDFHVYHMMVSLRIPPSMPTQGPPIHTKHLLTGSSNLVYLCGLLNLGLSPRETTFWVGSVLVACRFWHSHSTHLKDLNGYQIICWFNTLIPVLP